MTNEDPDWPVKRYVALMESLTSPVGIDYSGETGVIWEAICARCLKADWTDGGKGLEGAACRKCHAKRKKLQVYLPLREVQSGRTRRTYDPKLESAADIGRRLAKIGKWELRAWWVYALECESYELASDELQRRWPHHRRAWNRDYAAYLVKRARENYHGTQRRRRWDSRAG